MRSKLHLSLILTLIFSISSTFATTYYLDNSGGSNANNGLSPETAWKDLFKIGSSFPSPGGTYLFKRGERWEQSGQWYISYSGSPGQAITFGAYGNSIDPLPIISNVSPLTGADDPTNWTLRSTDIWAFSLVESPRRLFLDGVEYLRSDTLYMTRSGLF